MCIRDRLNALGGKHGIGIIDIVENRVVGMKSRGVYETPGGTILMEAHDQLEELILDRETMETKKKLGSQFAQVVYEGKWFTPLREAIQAFVESTQKYVTGAMVEGEIAAKKIVSQLNEERDKEKASDESTEKKALDAKITEYNRYLSNEGGMYETEALEEAMQKVMDEYAGGISTHYQFNEKQLALAKEKIEKIEKLAENVNAGDMHELMFVYELKERLTVCKSVIAHLFARKETRWHSFDENLDYPKKSGDWLKYVNSKMEDGKITVFTRKLVGREEHYEHHDESGAL